MTEGGGELKGVRLGCAADLDIAEEEAHDLLGLGGEGVGEACEPHLLADLHRGQRHLRRRRQRWPPIGWGFGAAVDWWVRGSCELEPFWGTAASRRRLAWRVRRVSLRGWAQDTLSGVVGSRRIRAEPPAADEALQSGPHK